MKLAIVYYSESGNTKQAAEYVAEGMKKAGAEVGLFELDKIDEAFVAEAKAVVFGAPTFYADTCGCSARACWYTRAAVHWANR